jgi:hypothetical protein
VRKIPVNAEGSRELVCEALSCSIATCESVASIFYLQNLLLRLLPLSEHLAKTRRFGLMAADNVDASGLLAEAGKGKPLPAIVERVGNGGSLNVVLLPDLKPAAVLLAGVQVGSVARVICCARGILLRQHTVLSGALSQRVTRLQGLRRPQAPSMSRRPPPTEEDPEPQPVPEPFAREAKHFTEVCSCVSSISVGVVVVTTSSKASRLS